FAPLLVMTVYGWARERGADHAWALVGAAAIAWVPSTYDVAASAYVDLALASYTALAVRAFGRWWVSVRWGPLAWLALGIGGGTSVQLRAGILAHSIAVIRTP